MSYFALSDLFDYLFYESTAIYKYFYSNSAGIDVSLQTSDSDV